MSKKKNEKKGQGLWRRLSEFGDEVLGPVRMEWRGRTSLTVDGASKIESCGRERVTVRLRGECVIILGSDLICRSFQNGVLVIGGRIDSVAYAEGGDQWA